MPRETQLRMICSNQCWTLTGRGIKRKTTFFCCPTRAKIIKHLTVRSSAVGFMNNQAIILTVYRANRALIGQTSYSLNSLTIHHLTTGSISLHPGTSTQPLPLSQARPYPPTRTITMVKWIRIHLKEVIRHLGTGPPKTTWLRIHLGIKCCGFRKKRW